MEVWRRVNGEKRKDAIDLASKMSTVKEKKGKNN